MAGDSRDDRWTRRGFLGAGSTAIAASVLGADSALAQQTPSGDRSASNPGPTNAALDVANPSANVPLPTDAGGVPTFKYPFSFGHKRFQQGGWSREVTVRELSVSKALAGVDMRLTAGGVRELHWHTAAEWAFMMYGSARITCIDLDGKSFVADVKEGDLWYFPPGIPHSIQGHAPDGAEFMLVFDDGNFSEFETVQLSDWMAHTPPDIIAKNFGVTPAALANMPKRERFIFQTGLPGPLADDQRAAAGVLGASPIDFVFRSTQPPAPYRATNGDVRIIDSSSFKISTTISAAVVTLKPGAMRELHWHPNADEWQFFLSGKGRQTVFATGGHARTMDFEMGDVGYVQKTLPHYVENTGTTDMKFLEIFKSPQYQDLALSEWLSHAPPALVAAHLGLDRATIDKLPKNKPLIMP